MKTSHVILLFAFSTLAVSSSGVASQLFEAEIQHISNELTSALDHTNVKTVAVIDFADLQGNTSELGRFIAEELSTGLVMAKKSFAVVDRANLKRIMDEHKLTVAGLVDRDNAKKLGELAGVDALIAGTITPLDQNVRVGVKVIATDTAKIVTGARADIPNSPDLEKLLGRDVVGTSRSDVRSVGGKSRTVSIGRGLTATIESIRVVQRGEIEVYVTFTNSTPNELVVFAGDPSRSNMWFPGIEASQKLSVVASDDNGIRYVSGRIDGMAQVGDGSERGRHSEYCMFPGINLYTVVPPNDKAQVRFSLVPFDTVERQPSAINFTAELRIVTDTRARRGYNRTLSVLNFLLDRKNH